jgi:hypothetical protein
MLANQLKLTRTFKPRHQTRTLRTLERGYWYLSIDVTETGADRGNGHGHKDGHYIESNGQPKHKDCGHSKSGNGNDPWSVRTFLCFWDFLSTFISREGRAGWGVWCICDRALSIPSSPISPAQPPVRHESAVVKQLDVKIYTWGEVAPHIYLLMYLASERKVRSVANVQWRDANEQAVILMG